MKLNDELIRELITRFFASAALGDTTAVRQLLPEHFTWLGKIFHRNRWSPDSRLDLRLREQAPRVVGIRSVCNDQLLAMPRRVFGDFVHRAFGERGMQGHWVAVDIDCRLNDTVTALVNVDEEDGRPVLVELRDSDDFASAYAWLSEEAARLSDNKEPQPTLHHPSSMRLGPTDGQG